ncbi:MAG: hypothetical protein ACFFCV_15570 [Promethearchaeota archaeon]
MDGKVNSESDSNENSFEMKIHEARNRGEGSFLVFVEGLSMYPLFEPGSRVPVKLMPKGTEYEVGDIIVFKSFDSYVIHAVIDSYVYKGKTYYVTGGLNQETNPYVDCTTISSDHILGLADLSEEFLAGIPALESQGLLFEIEVLGMSNQFDLLNNKMLELEELTTEIDENNKEEKFDRILKIMYEVSTTEHAEIQRFAEYRGKDGFNRFNQMKREILKSCHDFIVSHIFTGYSAEIFKVIFNERLGMLFRTTLLPSGADLLGFDLDDLMISYKDVNVLIKLQEFISEDSQFESKYGELTGELENKIENGIEITRDDLKEIFSEISKDFDSLKGHKRYQELIEAMAEHSPYFWLDLDAKEIKYVEEIDPKLKNTNYDSWLQDEETKKIQLSILKKQWGGRCALVGILIETQIITRHHLRLGNTNKRDCSLSALVPVLNEFHKFYPGGAPHTELWTRRFEDAKSYIEKGFAYIPSWWDENERIEYQEWLVGKQIPFVLGDDIN